MEDKDKTRDTNCKFPTTDSPRTLQEESQEVVMEISEVTDVNESKERDPSESNKKSRVQFMSKYKSEVSKRLLLMKDNDKEKPKMLKKSFKIIKQKPLTNIV